MDDLKSTRLSTLRESEEGEGGECLSYTVLLLLCKNVVSTTRTSQKNNHFVTPKLEPMNLYI